MAEREEVKIVNTVSLLQCWLSKKNPIPTGSRFLIKQENKIIVLVECEGYPKGKFIYDTGEEFDIGKHVDCEFIPILEKEEEKETVYDEQLWDAVDNELNGKEINGKKTPLRIKDESSPIILKTLGKEQKNSDFRNIVIYDVTKLIETLLKQHNQTIEENELNKIYNYLNYNNYPFFTKEKLMMIFTNCNFEKTNIKGIIKIKKQNKEVGLLIKQGDKFFFVPKNKSLSDEYSIEENKSTGFYFTAESYLDIALSTIKKYKNEFLSVYNTNPTRNSIEFGYQASSTIKTLFAFSCECYLKALLINNGQTLENIKAHNLSILYTTLDDEMIAKIFGYMETNGYDLPETKYEPSIETNSLTEKFMLDLARTDNAFIDSRYCAEADKNTDYEFLYRFALALRNSAKNEFIINSPFTDSIESKINKR